MGYAKRMYERYAEGENKKRWSVKIFNNYCIQSLFADNLHRMFMLNSAGKEFLSDIVSSYKYREIILASISDKELLNLYLGVIISHICNNFTGTFRRVFIEDTYSSIDLETVISVAEDGLKVADSYIVCVSDISDEIYRAFLLTSVAMSLSILNDLFEDSAIIRLLDTNEKSNIINCGIKIQALKPWSISYITELEIDRYE